MLSMLRGELVIGNIVSLICPRGGMALVTLFLVVSNYGAPSTFVPHLEFSLMLSLHSPACLCDANTFGSR